MEKVNSVVWWSAVSIGVTLVLAALIYKALRFAQRSLKMPPGPLLPLLKIKNEEANDLDKFLNSKKSWGDLTSFRAYHMLCIFANSHETITALLQKHGDYTSGRYRSNFRHRLFDFNTGVIGTDGDAWRQRRSFILGVFRTFGFSKYEEPIAREREYMVEQFKQQQQSAFNPLMAINGAVSNVIYQLLFGDRMDRGEMKQFEVVITKVNEFVNNQSVSKDFMTELLGRAVYLLPGDPFHAKRRYQNLTDLGEFFDVQIARLKSEANTGDATCLLDALLRESSFSDVEIRSLMFDLLVAGMETTTTTLRWALLLLAKHPEVQRRIRAEIKETLEGKAPKFNDRARLPYTEAVLHEIERYVTIVPMSVPHRVTSDFMMDQYLIPKDAVVFPNLYTAHHDKRVWPHASEFNPSNFYNDEKKCVINTEYLIPFSVGKRACLGETLAKQELFVFFCGLLQNFQFEESETEPLPPLNDLTAGLVFVRSPKPYKIVALTVT